MEEAGEGGAAVVEQEAADIASTASSAVEVERGIVEEGGATSSNARGQEGRHGYEGAKIARKKKKKPQRRRGPKVSG